PVPSLHSGPSSGFTFPGNLYFNVSIVRGGSEHGVGIYVSLVEPGSSAEREGLRVGDQIVAANDILFDNVTHIEAVKVGLHANAGVYECDCCGVCTRCDSSSRVMLWDLFCAVTQFTAVVFHWQFAVVTNTSRSSFLNVGVRL
uniref:PDZ domain-containing protein n=1 Tax=Pundamilia nyererei TaxID=303518 RepID=A0A3B4FHL6_9CICH